MAVGLKSSWPEASSSCPGTALLMNEILSVATRYFDRFEAVSLYPGPRSIDFWLALLGAACFAAGLAWYVSLGAAAQSGIGPTLLVVASDAALIGSGRLVRRFHRREVLRLANEGRGSNLQTLEAAKAATLCRLFDVRSSAFLGIAIEIERLRSLSSLGLRATSGWRGTTGLGEEAKSRLTSILLGALAALMTLLATSPAVQDDFFAAVSSTWVWELVLVLEFVALVLFSLWLGARWLGRVGLRFAMGWSVKLSASAWARQRKVDYLVRDLAALHRRSPRRARPRTPR